ncbi:MAG: hypothetical protein JWN23_2802 [Rhodocyclales bacterium]|nr:hypothetical protein [Rhodocyclales bacterium]
MPNVLTLPRLQRTPVRRHDNHATALDAHQPRMKEFLQ